MEITLHCLVRHARFAGMTTLALGGEQRKIGKAGRHTSTAQRAVRKVRGYTPATRASGRVPRWLAKRPDGTRGRTTCSPFPVGGRRPMDNETTLARPPEYGGATCSAATHTCHRCFRAFREDQEVVWLGYRLCPYCMCGEVPKPQNAANEPRSDSK